MFLSLLPLFNQVFTTCLCVNQRSLNKHPNHFTCCHETQILNLLGASYALDMVHLMVSTSPHLDAPFLEKCGSRSADSRSFFPAPSSLHH
jgi:hypothetical protein